MPRTRSKPHTQRPVDADPTEAPSWPAWLTRAAFVLAVALVLARATMLETIRNPLDVNPGSEAIPRGPGAGTGIVLDLLCCVPALLVLARRLLDHTFSLRWRWSFAPLALLGAWTVASTLWAGDRFAALVGGMHWLCAGVFLWSAAQLVRDWTHQRLVAAACTGLLLVQVGQGLYHRYVEHPDLVESWRAQREEIIRQRGWDPDSFIARQFEKRVLSGEMMGFNSSPNSYAAVLVLLTFVAAGVAVQRLADRDGPAWAAAPAAAAALGLLVIVLVNSRTALGTAALGAATLAAVGVLRRPLGRHPRAAYALGGAAVVLAAAAVVGHGLYHGTLFHDSLTFRWRYWVAGATIFAQHPIVGVGWENFGAHYLAHRLPIAAEEVKDPHNFIVRFATELGAVGLVLVLAWLARLWWDLTQTRLPPAAADDAAEDRSETAGLRFETRRDSQPLAVIAAIGLIGVTINLQASVDWDQSAAYNALEVMRRLGFLCLFVIGAALTAIRPSQQVETDDRPAPWVVYAVLVGLGLFFLHNLVDFSLFEPGPMFLFALLCGSALGMRAAADPARRGTGSRAAVATALAGAAAAWLLGFVVAVRVGPAEGAADAGDEALRTLSPGVAADHFARAAERVPFNADYAFRAARAALAHPAADPAPALTWLDRAIAADPNRPQYWLHRAYARLRTRSPDVAAVRADYEQALRLDPNNVDVRLEYAEVLRRFGDPAAAAEQYRLALHYNDLLSPDEPKRLPPARVDEVKRAVAELGG